MSFFEQDSPFSTVMSRIGDLGMVNIAWVVCSLPVVTIGASTSAMYEVVRSLHEGHDQHVLRQFGHAFTRRLGTSVAMTAIAAAFLALVAFNLRWLTLPQASSAMSAVAYGVIVFLAAVVLAGAGFIFPAMSRSKLSLWQQIRQSFRIAAFHPLTAVGTLALNLLPFAITAVIPGGFAFVTFFYGLVLTAVSAYEIVAMMLRAGIIALRD